MNGLESILRDDALALEIARKLPLLQQGESAAGVSAGGVRSGTESISRRTAARRSGGGGVVESVAEITVVADRPRESATADRGPVVSRAPVSRESSSAAEARETVGAAVSSTGLNEAIVKRFGRPVLLVRNDTFEVPASDTWKAILYPHKSKLDAALRSVGRVEIVDSVPPYIGTAWMIGSDIAVTNRHVANLFARREGSGWTLRRNPIGRQYRVRVDFKEEYLQTVPFEADVVEVLYVADDSDETPDLAFIRLRAGEGRPLPPPLPLFDGTATRERKIAVIGYPAEDSRNGAADQARIFSNIFDVKRLAPGEVTGDEDGFVFTHDCTTLGGNSGSPVLDIETGAVMGLHFAGEYLLNNYAVAARTLRQRLDDVGAGASTAPATPPVITLETAIVPKEAVRGRPGYREDFLGRTDLRVPLPTLGPGLDAIALEVDADGDGGGTNGMHKYMLTYTHFSVAMHRDRRMALFTASNIDGGQSRRIKRQKDVWAFDPRIDEAFQIGNELYENNDLDRGHLVRRLDPAWGDAREAKQAEEDTFFFTNCTPQHSAFNQKLWLSLEDYLLGNADTRDFKACLFTGPIFSERDLPYRDALLPLAYWKVAVMVRAGSDEDDESVTAGRTAEARTRRRQLSATAYIVSQKELLSDLEFVFGQFKTYQVRIAEVERRTNLQFGELKQFDPLDREEGVAIRELVTLEDIRI